MWFSVPLGSVRVEVPLVGGDVGGEDVGVSTNVLPTYGFIVVIEVDRSTDFRVKQVPFTLVLFDADRVSRVTFGGVVDEDSCVAPDKLDDLVFSAAQVDACRVLFRACGGVGCHVAWEAEGGEVAPWVGHVLVEQVVIEKGDGEIAWHAPSVVVDVEDACGYSSDGGEVIVYFFGCFHDVLRLEELVAYVGINGMDLAESGHLLFHVGGGGAGLLVVSFVGLSWVASTGGVVMVTLVVVFGGVFDGALKTLPGLCAARLIFYH